MAVRTGVSVVVAILVSGCMAPVGTRGVVVPPDAAVTCAQHCTNIAMELSAVAIMANNVGCVCQRPTNTGAASREAATTAGMATIMMQEIARQQQEQQAQQQRQQQQQH